MTGYRAVDFEELYASAKSADEGTWEAMQRAFEAAIDWPDAPEPPAAECVALVLRLHAAAERKSADALAATFARWIERDARNAPSEELAYRWTIAQELSAATLPKRLRKAIAEAARDGSVERAYAAVREYCARRSDEKNAARIASLRAQAPNIARALEGALSGGRTSADGYAPRRPAGSGAMLVLLFALAAIVLIAIAGRMKRTAAPRATTFPPIPTVVFPPAEPADAGR